MKIGAAFYWHVFKQMLWTDFVIFRQGYKSRFVDLAIWVGIIALIMGYIMPSFGVSADYGQFQLVGLIANAGLFDTYPNVMILLTDFQTHRVIGYDLTLPIPSWLVLIKIMCNFIFKAMFLGVCAIPIGKLVLWNQFDLTKIAIIPATAMIIALNTFYGTFTLWLASVISSTAQIGKVWTRCNFPLTMLGGFYFSWHALYKASPMVAYIDLANPMIYATEGMRAAMLGQEGFLPVWQCVFALCVFSLLCALDGMRRLKKRLDFV